MPILRLLPAALVLVAMLGAQGAWGASETPAPQGLHASYDATAKMVKRSWSATPRGDGMPPPLYRVWRDAQPIGMTDAGGFQDQPPSGSGWVYFVTLSQDGGATWSVPSLVGVAGISCEIVTVSTSWDSPYVYAHLHQECLGLTFDKDVTWFAGP